MNDFDYLGESEVYLDSACQSLRPRPVLEALGEYYEKFNSCGERVKYPWGVETDRRVNETRAKVLKYLKLSPKKYFVAFTLNTTYGLNLILSQLKKKRFSQIITSDVVVNAASNIDGRKLANLKELTELVHRSGGIIIIDAAQAMAHSVETLYKSEVDAICFSAHKMYAPSLGGMVIRKSLLEDLKPSFVGGGMVDDVFENNFLLSAEQNPEHLPTRFEAGLQAFGEAIALGAAIDWLEKTARHEHKNLEQNYTELFSFLRASKKVHLVNQVANPTMSFYVEGIDSHLLGEALGAEKIMARTGYFCAHYYLDKVKHLPPLVRFSLGYHNRPSDVEKVKQIMRKIV